MATAEQEVFRAAVEEELGGDPVPFTALKEALHARFPDAPVEALGHRARERLPMLQVPPRGLWRRAGGVVYALFQHDLKRLLALHSIENVGIIVLGLGACLVLRARGAELWAAFALAAALLHTITHAVFKALLFLGAGAFERGVGPW